MMVWERSLISVPIGVYLGLIEVRTWLGESVASKEGEKQLKRDRMHGSNSPLQRPVSSLGGNNSSGTTRWSIVSHEHEVQYLQLVTCVSVQREEENSKRTWLRRAPGHGASDAFGHDENVSRPLCCQSNSGGAALGRIHRRVRPIESKHSGFKLLVWLMEPTPLSLFLSS
jgi:hypothetical protein